MPTDQAKSLCLWDKIDLLHAEKKQILGRIITILRFEVDANAMSAYLGMEKWEQLIDSIHKFTWGSLKTLWEWLRLAGQFNWALNVYLWLRPGLGGIYMKTAGKIQMWGRIKINKQFSMNWHSSLNMSSNHLDCFSSNWWCGKKTMSVTWHQQSTLDINLLIFKAKTCVN